MFNSKYFCPRTSHVNAFTDDWIRNHNWLCPPISCIGSVLRHLILFKARGALLVPIWPSSYYWPLMYPDRDQMADFVRQYIVIEPLYSPEVRRSESLFNGYPKQNVSFKYRLYRIIISKYSMPFCLISEINHPRQLTFNNAKRS